MNRRALLAALATLPFVGSANAAPLTGEEIRERQRAYLINRRSSAAYPDVASINPSFVKLMGHSGGPWFADVTLPMNHPLLAHNGTIRLNVHGIPMESSAWATGWNDVGIDHIRLCMREEAS